MGAQRGWIHDRLTCSFLLLLQFCHELLPFPTPLLNELILIDCILLQLSDDLSLEFFVFLQKNGGRCLMDYSRINDTQGIDACSHQQEYTLFKPTLNRAASISYMVQWSPLTSSF